MPNPSVMRISSRQRRGEPDTERRDQRYGNHGRRDAADVVGNADRFGGAKNAVTDTNVAADDHYGQRPAHDDSGHAEHERHADGERHRQPQSKRVLVLRGRGVCNRAAGGRGVGSFSGDGRQRRLGDSGAESKQEREDKEPNEAASLRKRIGEGIAEREERQLEAVDEQGKACEDEQGAFEQRKETHDRLLHDDKLKEQDDRHHGGEVAERSEDYAPKSAIALRIREENPAPACRPA